MKNRKSDFGRQLKESFFKYYPCIGEIVYLV